MKWFVWVEASSLYGSKQPTFSCLINSTMVFSLTLYFCGIRDVFFFKWDSAFTKQVSWLEIIFFVGQINHCPVAVY